MALLLYKGASQKPMMMIINLFTQESYNNPQRLSFQIHGQDGPHSYRWLWFFLALVPFAMITMISISTLIISDTGMTLGWGTTDSSNTKRGTITESFTEGGFSSYFIFLLLYSPSRKVVLMVLVLVWWWRLCQKDFPSEQAIFHLWEGFRCC